MQQYGLNEPRFSTQDENALLECLRSTWVATGGSNCLKFEAEIANIEETKYCTGICNGTAALQIIFEVLKRKYKIKGSYDVLVPSLTFVGTANSVIHAGGNPVPIDSSPDSIHPSTEYISGFIKKHYGQHEKLLISKSSGFPLLAVMPVNLLGWMGDLEGLEQYLDEISVPMVVDNAEGLGVESKTGRASGSFGLASALSFNGNKILTTGAGGMICTKSASFWKETRHLATTSKTNGLKYEHDDSGFNSAMPNLSATLGLSQLISLPERIEKKGKILSWYQEELKDSDIYFYTEHKTTGKSNNWLITGVLASYEARETTLKYLNENKILARPLWTPLHKQIYLEKYIAPDTSFPNAEHFWQRCLSLPSSFFLKREDISFISNKIRTALKPKGGIRD